MNNHLVAPQNVLSLLQHCVPSQLDIFSVKAFVKAVHDLKVCVGSPETKFVDLVKKKKNSVLLSKNKEIAAYVDGGFCVALHNQQYQCTVHTSDCHLLINSTAVRCPLCTRYRLTLTSLYYRLQKQSSSNQKRSTNYRYVPACIFASHVCLFVIVL